MTNTALSAKMPPRELAVLAVMNGLVDWTPAEVSRYALLRIIGRTHDDACKLARTSNKSIRENIDQMQTTTDKHFSVQIPQEWLDTAKNLHPELNNSTLYRYAILRLSGNNDEAALEMATRFHGGGWTKGKPRKTSNGGNS